jgi:hypothetical protein
MSDFEDRLRSLELRQPEPEWQREIFERCTFTEPRSAWQQWLWPSPLAWAALVMIWFGLAVANHGEKPVANTTTLSDTQGLSLFALGSQDSDSFWAMATSR